MKNKFNAVRIRAVALVVFAALYAALLASCGTEQTESNGIVSVNMDGYTSEEELRAEYPDFFEIDTSNGIYVYIWRTSETEFFCRPVSKNDREAAETKLKTELIGCSLSQMARILRIYGIATDDVETVAWDHPRSDYNESKRSKKELALYEENLRTLLQIDDREHLYHTIHCAYIGDIDRDGTEEASLIYYSNFSGRSAFVVEIVENGSLEYETTVVALFFREIAFVRKDEEIRILGVGLSHLDEEVISCTYDIAFANGKLTVKPVEEAPDTSR